MERRILVERRGRVATVTFNSPEKRNAIDYEGWCDLSRVTRSLAAEDEIRAVVFTGKGDRAFSAGADIGDFDRRRSNPEQARDYARVFGSAVDAIAALPQPSICSIKGYCLGGGCELSVAADIRIAADGSRFGIPTAKLGIAVGYDEMRRLVNAVGPANASYILLTGRLVEASDALRMGLVHRVLPPGEIDAFVVELAGEIASLAPLSHRYQKEILQTVLRNPALSGLTPAQRDLPLFFLETEDYREGRRAFRERRPPAFKGR